MEYLVHLSKDRKLKKLLDAQTPFSISKRKDIHFYLIASIMSQQLSTKVANTIRQRFLAIWGPYPPARRGPGDYHRNPAGYRVVECQGDLCS
jgi:DNA-3-methyladenine glycosylase II